MQIKTTVSYHLILLKMAIIKKSTNNDGEDVEKREPSYTVGGNVDCYSQYTEKVWVFLKKLGINLHMTQKSHY